MRGLYAKDGLMLSRHGEAGVDPAACLRMAIVPPLPSPKATSLGTAVALGLVCQATVHRTFRHAGLTYF